MAGRRRFLARALALAALPHAGRVPGVDYPAVVGGTALGFPADFGAHPAFRTEWWYLTGWLEDAAGAPLGMQVTFFRHRPGIGESSESRFAPRELLFAHAALADPALGKLRHDQRAARAGFGLAGSTVGATDVHIDRWRLVRRNDTYAVEVDAAAFGLDLAARTTGRPWLQGEAGISRKGPAPGQASFYYSEPQLAVSGRVTIEGAARAVTGRAWLDHEWSSEYLPDQAAGWDWTGINLDDGGALMAFVMRRHDGGALMAGGGLRLADGSSRVLAAAEVRFTPRRTWRSPRTGAIYPVAMRIDAGGRTYDLEPLFDDQELDARRSTGTIYWEGAVRASSDGREVGRGYLELTGYAGPLRM